MSRVTDPSLPTTAMYKNELFEDAWERRWFIEEWITSPPPSHAMPWELDEQRRNLGATLVRVEEDEFSPFSDPRIMGEMLFIDAMEHKEKRELTGGWARATARRDICPVVLSYRLNGDNPTSRRWRSSRFSGCLTSRAAPASTTRGRRTRSPSRA